ARAKLEGLHNQSHQQGELEKLRAENTRLKAEVAQFQHIKQLLGGSAGVSTTPSDGAIASPITHPAPYSKTSVVPSQKRIRDQDQALDKISEANDLIMAWNDDPSHDSNHKWFISVRVILSLIRGSGFSASQGRVQAVMAQRKEEIDSHHQKHGLGQRHNSRHDLPITEDIVL